MRPALSVIMVDGGFRERFDMLASWEDQTLDPDRHELIWVEYTDRVAPAVGDNPRWQSVALGRDEPLQQLAYAYNEGIRRAKGDIIVLPDADVCCPRDLLATVLTELSADPHLVLYVLRLDQPAEHCRLEEDIEHLKATCTVKHTYNFGGCTAVHRQRLIEMNGYEQLPIFAGYPYNGGDNYIRFKNMGLKIRWHPTQRVYHPWHA
ncbi:MAG: glycosyltransferase family 2 protein, partial [Planctomycetota bacterium]